MTINKSKPLVRYAGYEMDRRDRYPLRPQEVLALFRKGLDTWEIAQRYKTRIEAEVYSALARADRQCQV